MTLPPGLLIPGVTFDVLVTDPDDPKSGLPAVNTTVNAAPAPTTMAFAPASLVGIAVGKTLLVTIGGNAVAATVSGIAAGVVTFATPLPAAPAAGAAVVALPYYVGTAAAGGVFTDVGQPRLAYPYSGAQVGWDPAYNGGTAIYGSTTVPFCSD